MSEQLQLFEVTAAPQKSIREWEVDTQGKGRKQRAPAFIEETAWDDGSAWTTSTPSTEKNDTPSSTEKNSHFREGDRVAAISGAFVGKEGTVTDVDGRWVCVKFDGGRIEALDRGELFPAQEASTVNSISGLHVSFGKTLTPLLAGLKTVTRREWKDSHAQKFIRAFDNGSIIRAFDKDQRYGGRRVGWLWLTDRPYKEWLSQMPEKDLAAEGFASLNLDEFRSRFFPREDDQCLWVIRFKFIPSEDIASAPDFSVDESPPYKRHSKSGRPSTGWVESQEKTVQGKHSVSTYYYHYYRYEIWDGDILLSTPAIPVEPKKLQFLSETIASGFSVDEIIDRRHHWEKKRKRST